MAVGLEKTLLCVCGGGGIGWKYMNLECTLFTFMLRGTCFNMFIQVIIL